MRGSQANASAISSRRRSPWERTAACSLARPASPTVSRSLWTRGFTSSMASSLRHGRSASPALASTGTEMFSSTVSRGKTLVTWKVRAIPSDTRALGGSRVTSLPAKTMLPRSGRSLPARRLIKVVLPAPLGPMTAVMPPSCNVRSTPATAVKSSNGLRHPAHFQDCRHVRHLRASRSSTAPTMPLRKVSTQPSSTSPKTSSQYSVKRTMSSLRPR